MNPFALLHPIQSDPFQYAGQYAQLQALAQQRQERQQQMAQTAQQMQLQGVQLQQAQQALQDQQVIRQRLPQMMGDPQYQTNGQFDWEKGLRGLMGDISPTTAMGLQKTILDNQKAHADAAKLQADADRAAQETTDKQTAARVAVQDAISNQAQDWIDHGRNAGVLDANLLHIEDLYPNAKPQIETMRQHIAQNPDMANGIMDQLAGQLSVGGRQARAQLAKETALGSKETAAANIETMKLNAMKTFMANPQAGEAQIDTILPPQAQPQMNTAFKTRYQAAMQQGDLAGAKEAIAAATEYAGRLQYAQDPNVRRAEVQKAVDVAKATSGIEISKDIQKQVALARLSPDAFGSILSPQARFKAQGDYEKMSNEAADKIGSARQLRDAIALAQKGNKAAPGVIPLETVRSFVNRVNRQELESVSGAAGSLLDKVQGWYGKWEGGQPIPPDILRALDELAQHNEAAAQRGYGYKLNVLNQTYGSKAQPVQFPEYAPAGQPGAAQAAQGGYQIGHKYGGLTYLGGDPKSRNSWKQ